MGKTLGAVVGAAFGLWIGALLGMLPGAWAYGAMDILTMLGGASFSSIFGALAGGVLENILTRGLPRDELFYYLHALQNDRWVIIVCAKRRRELVASRRILILSGALMLDPARKARRVGIRCSGVRYEVQQ